MSFYLFVDLLIEKTDIQLQKTNLHEKKVYCIFIITCHAQLQTPVTRAKPHIIKDTQPETQGTLTGLPIALTFPLCVLDSRTMECTDSAEECPKDRPPEHGNWVSPCHFSHNAILTVFEHTNQFWPHQVQVLLPKITHL